MIKYLRQPSVRLALTLMAASFLILAGWHFRIPLLKGAILGSFVAPNSALCFILCSISILCFSTGRSLLIRFGYILATLVLLFSVTTLLEWRLNVDLGFDRLFFAHRLNDWTLPYPGRFSVNAGIGFTLASLALLTVRSRTGTFVSEILSSLLLLTAYLSLVGYAYSVPALYSSGNIMALPTALLFTILSVALLYLGNRWLIGIVASPYAGGMVSRRFVSAVVVIMPILGWFTIQIRKFDYLSRELAISLLVLSAVLIFTLLALRTAAKANEIDSQRLQTQNALRYSEQLQAEAFQQVKLNLKRLELIENTVHVGTWEFDPVTGLSHWPPGISALWGLPPEEHHIAFEDFVSRIHPEDRQNVARIVESALKSQDTYDVEFRVVWPDKSIHWLAARAAVVRDATGTPTKVLGIALDVTDRHRTEKALRDSEKLAATGRLAATIAHEINNPLEAVVNLVFLAKNDPALPPDSRELLEAADVELARVSHMVRQTLGFYRDSSNPSWIDVSEITSQIVGLFRNKLQRKNVRVDIETVPSRVYGFEGELRQVISNLVSNAIDAAAMEGRIRIRVSKNSTHVNITVADNGHGIETEHRARLFQPFFTTKRDIGTGLGLWVSKGIIEKHRGRIRFRSSTRPGSSGTVFSIYLPVDSGVTVAQSAALTG